MKLKGGALIKMFGPLLILAALVLFLVQSNGVKAAPGQAEGAKSAGKEKQTPFVGNQILIKVSKESTKSLKAARVQNPKNTGLKSLDQTNTKLKVKASKKVFDKTPQAKNGQTAEDLDRWIVVTLDSAATTSNQSLEKTNVTVGGQAMPYQDVMDTYRRTPGVEAVAPNYIYTPSYVPNDTYYSTSTLFPGGIPDLWGLNKINAGAAWDTTSGNGSVVALVDTGVDYNHPDLAASILRDGSGNVVGYDYANNDADPMDDVGHGTHVAGIIAATGNNDPNHGTDSGTRVVGAGFGLKIMPVKFMGPDGGTTTGAVNAFNFAVAHGASVISNSWGSFGPSEDPLLNDALKTLHDENIITVFAANNSDRNVNLDTPAGNPYIITVGASNYEDQKSSFSDYGARVDLVAPGGDYNIGNPALNEYILSTITSSNLMAGFPMLGSYYGELYGTSMATGFVSAAAALVKTQHPNWSFEEVRFALRDTADVLGGKWNSQTGAGRLNLNTAVNLTQAPPTAFLDIPENTVAAPGYVINGSVAAANTVSSWSLSYGEGADPSAWVTINSGTAAISGELGQISDVRYGGTLTLKLAVTDGNSHVSTTYADVDCGSGLLAGWPKDFGRTLFTHPAIADINGDGQNEIIITNQSAGQINAVVSNGTALAGFPVQAGSSDYFCSPTVADINGDGRTDILTINYSQHKLFIVNGNGQTLSGWPVTIPLDQVDDVICSDLTVADINGDGRPEILFESWAGKLFAYQNNGQPLAGFPVYMGVDHSVSNFYGAAPTVAVRDVNADGKGEIFAGRVDSQNNGYIYRLDYQGNILSGWPQPFDYSTFPTLAATPNVGLADINGDGQIEVVGFLSGHVSTQDSSPNNIKAWTAGGVALWAKDTPTTLGGPSAEGGPFFADVDGDGRMEVITSGDGLLYGYNGLGQTLTGWPISTGFHNGSDISMADVNNNGSVDFIGFGNDNTSFFIKIIDPSAPSFTWIKRSFDQIEVGAVVGDVNNDGKMELVNNGRYAANHNTYVWKLDDSSCANNALVWPQVRGDAAHSGTFPVDNSALSTSFSSFHVTISSAGSGSGTFDQVSPVTVTDGSWLDITATPDASSSFTSWTGCDSVTGNVCHITSINADRTVTATFDLLPAAPSGVSIGTITTTGFTVGWTDNSSGETGFKVYTTDTGTSDCATANYSGNPDFTTAANAVSQAITGKSINTQYCAAVKATSASGDSVASYASAKYTLANVPSAPTVNPTSSTSLTAIINQNSNPVGTQYAILNQTANKYVKADGTMSDTTPVWQDYTTWGGGSGVANTGLSSNTAYTYQVKARNGDTTETALSGSGSNTTPVGYVVTIGKAGTGDGSFDQVSQTIDAGASLDTTATPNGSSNFSSWTGCDSTTGNVCHLTNITTNKSITATFTLKPYTVTINTAGNGSGTFNQVSPVTVTDGASLDTTATPNGSSDFTSWAGCDSTTSNVCHLVNITSDKTITATFRLKGVTISGTVYTSHDKSTNVGVGKTIAVSIYGTKFGTTAETNSNGAFSLYGGTNISNYPLFIAVYVDDEAGIEANLITQAIDRNTDITGLELYTGRIVLSHETAGPMTNDILADILGSSPDGNIHYTKNVAQIYFDTAYEVFIPSGKTFSATSAVSFGDITNRGTFSQDSSYSLYVNGSLDASGGIFNMNGHGVDFTSTSPGKTIASGNNSWPGIGFTGVGGGWSLTDTMVTGGLAVNSGTLSGNHDITVEGWAYGNGNGTISLTGGTFTQNGTGNFGGSDWTFYNLTFGNGTAGTTTKTGSGNINVTDTLTVAANQTLNMNNNIWTLSGNSGTPFVNNGTLISTTTTVIYTGNNPAGNTAVAAGSYYDLYLDNSAETFAAAGDITASRTFTINTGTFDGQSYTLTLSSTGTPFVNNGTFRPSTSTVKYSGAGDTDIIGTDYYNLELKAGQAVAVVDSYPKPTGQPPKIPIGGGSFDAAGQSFTGGGTLTGAAFYLQRSGSPSGSAYAKIYAATGDYGSSSTPTGSPLAVSDPFDVSTLTTSSQLVDFNFSGDNRLAMTDGAQYVLTFEYTGGDDSNYVGLGYAGGGATHSGNMSYLPSGASWLYMGNFDTYFYVYKEPSVPVYTLSAGAFNISNDLTVGDGTNPVIANADTHDPIVNASGDFDISANATFSASNSGTLNIAKNFTNSGAFTHNSGTVNLTGADSSTQQISGSTTFNNLSASTSGNSAGRTLQFGTGTTTTVLGTWTVTGHSGKVITLAPSSAATWYINPIAWAVDYISVSYSTNQAEAKINPTNSAGGDGGNNVNWFPVTPTAPSGVSIGTITTTGFTVGWTDNSSDETGFKVYTTAGNADCSVASYSGTPDYTTAANAVTQAITGKSVNTQYCAAVKATNAVGDSAASYASAKYTLANVPSAPTVNPTSSTSLTAIINQNSNPAGTEYAISAQLPTTPPFSGTDLAAWYSASYGVTVDGASKVQNWTPRYTSNGTGALVATTDDGGSSEGASTPPTLVPDGLNGKPTVRFTAAALTALKNVAGVGVNFNADDYTLVLVRNMNAPFGSYQTLLSAPGVAIRVHYIHYLLGDGSVSEQGFHSTPAITTWSLVVSGSSLKTYIGSTPTDNRTLQRNISGTGSGPVYIGRDLLNFASDGTFPATMDLSEILVFKKALTSDEIGTVYSDLTNNSELVTKYVQADGSLGASAVWQTYDQWGGASGIANTGLSVSTEYSYQVKARNGDLTETALSPSGSNTTLATDTAPATHGSKKKKSSETTPAETPISNEVLTSESIVEEITQSLHDYNVSPLSASFTMPSDNTTGSTVTFDASGSTSNKGIVKYEWDFGDWEKAEGMKVEHKYKSPGRYTVTLTVTDRAGNKNTITQTIDIKPVAPTITNITAKGTALWIEGKSDPGTTIYFTIHSNPFEGQGLANQDGYWTYYLDNASEVIGEGDHTILALAAVKLADNTELRGAPSKTYDFKMSVDNGKLQVEMKRTRVWQIVAGVFGLLFISLIIFLVLRGKRAQKIY